MIKKIAFAFALLVVCSATALAGSSSDGSSDRTKTSGGTRAGGDC